MLVLLLSSPAEAEDAGKLAFAARSAIKSASFVLDVTQHDSPSISPTKWTMHYYFDGTRRRFDKTSGQSTGEGDAVRESESESDGFLWSYNNLRPAGSAGVIAKMTSLGAIAPKLPTAVPDALWIGFIPSQVENFKGHSPQTFVDNESATDRSIRHGKLDGIACDVTEFRPPSGGLIRNWIARDLGASVLKVTSESKYEDGTMTVREVTSSVAKHAPSNLFFPQRVRFTKTVNGQLQQFQDIVVRDLKLNEPIAKEVFAFAGMGVPVGHPVSKFPNDPRGSLIWDGAEVIPVNPPKGYGYARWGFGRIALVGASALLAVLAGLCSWKWVVRSS